MDYGQSVHFFGLLIITLYIYIKILNIKDVSKLKKASAIIFSLIMSVVLSYRPFLYEVIFILSVFLFVFITTRVKMSLMLTSVVISTGISLGIEILAQIFTVVVQVILALLTILITRVNVFSEPMYLSIAIPLPGAEDIDLTPLLWTSIVFITSTVLVKFFFKIKRLKKGFVFLQSKEGGWIGALFCIVIMIIRGLGANIDKYISSKAGSIYLTIFMSLLIIISIIGINIWWLHHTNILYRQRLKEQIIQEYQIEIAEKDRQIKNLSESNKFLSEAVHRDNKLIPAMYNAVNNFLYNSDKSIGDQTNIKGIHILSELNEIMKERKEMVIKLQREHKSLSPTGMERIDNILNYMLQRASENGIQFDFVMAGSVKNMTENVIPKQSLETLLADLIENAIIATSYSPNAWVSSSSNERPAQYKKILVTMGIVESCFEITAQDSGIPFEAGTLRDLGLKKTTTHGDNGGSGIGYVTIFRILKESGASLIISEKESEDNAFSKSIKIRFDGKSEFILNSFRADEIKPYTERRVYLDINEKSIFGG